MNWAEALWWLPTAATAIIAILAVAAVNAQPPRPAKRCWLLGVALGGLLAVALSAAQQAASRAALVGETARLRELATRLDEVGRLLPAPPGGAAGGGFATVTAGVAALKAKIQDLEDQIRDLRQQMRSRVIAPDQAGRIADYLRPFGAQRVVVSCAPDDVEAFSYANQLANILRLAGWEALGPEKTTIFGEAPTMGVKLYVRPGAAAPEAARLLIDAFTRFNIAYQSGVAPSDAIPDPATVELFIGPKP